MKKFLLVLFVFSLFTACSPKDDGNVKDGTHKDDGVVYHEVVENLVI